MSNLLTNPIELITEFKQCITCGEYKSIDGFAKTYGKVKINRCKDCVNTQTRNRRRLNRDLVNAENRANYHKNKASYRATQKRYAIKIQNLAYSDKIIQAKSLVKTARHRAKVLNLEFNITYEDVPIPDLCPMLNISLIRSKGKGASPNSASIDRIDPNKGYVKGNVHVISYRANTIKSNANLSELQQIVKFLEQLKY